MIFFLGSCVLYFSGKLCAWKLNKAHTNQVNKMGVQWRVLPILIFVHNLLVITDGTIFHFLGFQIYPISVIGTLLVFGLSRVSTFSTPCHKPVGVFLPLYRIYSIS